MDDHDTLRRTHIAQRLFQGLVHAAGRLIVEMEGIQPGGPGFVPRELERTVSPRYRIMNVIRKTEDIRAVEAVGPIASDHRTRGQQQGPYGEEAGFHETK